MLCHGHRPNRLG